MTAPTAILRFNETEISTTDPVTVQTLWRFLSHCVTPAEYAAVDGRTEFQQPAQQPVRLHALEGGDTS
ncbi:MAG: hypothetical protein ABSC31_13615 [Acidimicrobiales bacterium]|jgi:hypothetical protein